MDDEIVITKAEITKATQERELKLADIKKNRDEYQAQKAAVPATNITVVTNTKTDTFNF